MLLDADGAELGRDDVTTGPGFRLGQGQTVTTPVALAATLGGFAMFWVETDALGGGQERQLTMGRLLETAAPEIQLHATAAGFGPPQLLPVLEAVSTERSIALLTGSRLLELRPGHGGLAVALSRDLAQPERPARLAWNAAGQKLAIMTAEPGYRRPSLRVTVLAGLDGAEQHGLQISEPAYVEYGGWSGHNGFDIAACGKGFYAVWRDDSAIAGCPGYGYCQVNDLVGQLLDGERHALSRPGGARPVRTLSPVLSGGQSLDLTWVHQPMDAGMAESSQRAERHGVVDCSCLSP